MELSLQQVRAEDPMLGELVRRGPGYALFPKVIKGGRRRSPIRRCKCLSPPRCHPATAFLRLRDHRSYHLVIWQGVTVMATREDIEHYLIQTGHPHETIDKNMWVVRDEASIVISYEPPLVI